MRLQYDRIFRAAIAPWRWFALRRRLALLLIPFGLAASRAEASEEAVLWTPVSLKQADRTRYDLELTLRARRILVEDPALARYEISVRINDRVAELSGPVPSMEIAQRAEANLKGLLGLASIRNRLTIEDKFSRAKEPVAQSRVDWRVPQYGSPDYQPTLVKAGFGGSPPEATSDSTFSWRAVRSSGQATAFSIPFMPEGLNRVPEVREQLRESTTGSREYLRIGRVDVISSPTEARQGQDPDAFVLPAIDLRNPESKVTTPAITGANDSNRLRYFFLGF